MVRYGFKFVCLCIVVGSDINERYIWLVGDRYKFYCFKVGKKSFYFGYNCKSGIFRILWDKGVDLKYIFSKLSS